MATPFRFTLKIDIEVHEDIVADGFDPSDLVARLRGCDVLRRIVGTMDAWPEVTIADHTTVKITREPSRARVLKAQGYADHEIARMVGEETIR